MKRSIIVLMLICSPSFAAYTTMTIEGVKDVNGVWTAAGVMDTQGFVRTTGAVTVAGTTRNLPVTLAADTAAAGSLVKGAARLAGPVALAAAAYDVYEWYTSGPITSTGNDWVLKSDFSSDYGYTPGSEWYASGFGGSYSSPDSGCQAYKESKRGVFLWSEKYSVTFNSPSSYTCKGFSNDMVYTTYNIEFTRRLCTTNQIQSCKPITPPSQQDFDNIPAPTIPIMISAWNNLPSLTPNPTPIKSTDFTPFSEWMSDPYFKDGNWWRDRMDVSPAPLPGQPTRVRIDIGPVKIEGATNPQQVPDTGPASGNTQPKEQTKFCDDNPQSIACQEMGKPDEVEPIEPDEKQFQLDTSQSWGAANGVCPVSPSVTLESGKTITFNYQPTCNFLTIMRPIIITFALLTAIFIAVGRVE